MAQCGVVVCTDRALPRFGLRLLGGGLVCSSDVLDSGHGPSRLVDTMHHCNATMKNRSSSNSAYTAAKSELQPSLLSLA